jgi:hypothetical protein
MANKPAAKAKKVFGKDDGHTVVSPLAIAAFAHVRKPDTEGQYADNKYKITLKLKKGDPAVEKFVKDLRSWAEEARKKQMEAWGKKKLEAFDPVKDGDEKDDAEEKGWAGFWLVTAKSKNKPNVRDAKKNIVPDSIKVFSGDGVKVAIGTAPFEKPVQNKGGISIYMNGVQLLAKNSSGYNDADAFEEEDGYETDTTGTEGGDGEEGSAPDNDGDY